MIWKLKAPFRSTVGFVRVAAIGVFALSCLYGSLARAVVESDADLDAWLSQETQISESRMGLNISPLGAVPGIIVASPSKTNPNYYYYWVRDGAMVMRSIVGLYEASSGTDRTRYQAMLTQYVAFSSDNQSKAASNLGEPRFNVDGAVNTEPWGRPQNDGPALRALTMMRYGADLIKEGQTAWVEAYLYSPQMPASTVIKTDLEYVAHNWQSPCVDLWEEIWGQHFFTRAVQLASLREGAKFAQTMNDPGAASFYTAQADLLEAQLAKHWSPTNGYYLATLDSQAGPDHQKPSQLDTAVLLAALAAEQDSGILSLADGRILSTADKLDQTFAKLYSINSNKSVGTAIGRYAEDYYFGGHPWVLTTAAFAELNYKLAVMIDQSKTFPLTNTQLGFFQHLLQDRVQGGLHEGSDLVASPLLKARVVSALFAKGDAYMERIRLHVPADGSLAEQINRDSGFMMSAPDLSWSYASFLRAFAAREASQTN